MVSHKGSAAEVHVALKPVLRILVFCLEIQYDISGYERGGGSSHADI